MISVICCTMRNNFMDNVFQNYESQIYEEKELIIILNKDDIDIDDWKKRAQSHPDISVYQLSEQMTLGECLNIGIGYSKYNMISKFDDDDYYSPQYLSNHMTTMTNINADVICKRTVYMYFEQNNLLALHLPDHNKNEFIDKVLKLKGSTLMMRKDVFSVVRFPEVNRGEDTQFLKSCLRNKLSIYVTDEKDYVCLRRYEGEHTWNVNNIRLMNESKMLKSTNNYKKFVKGD